jgi:hypothetical protein
MPGFAKHLHSCLLPTHLPLCIHNSTSVHDDGVYHCTHFSYPLPPNFQPHSEDEQRKQRGPNEEAMRRNEGQSQ